MNRANRGQTVRGADPLIHFALTLNHQNRLDPAKVLRLNQSDTLVLNRYPYEINIYNFGQNS